MVIDSMLLFVAVFLALGLNLMGFVTKQRIYNLASVGVYIFLGIQFAEFPALIVTFIALILFEFYYVFIGSVN